MLSLHEILRIRCRRPDLGLRGRQRESGGSHSMGAFVNSFAADYFSWFRNASGALDEGLWALALVCFIHSALTSHHLYLLRRQTQGYISDIARLTKERDETQNQRSLIQLENQLLREFVSAGEMAKASDVLLRHFAPNTSRDFAALLRLEDSHFVIDRSRGLSKSSCRGWTLPMSDLHEPSQGDAIVLRERDLRPTGLWNHLSAEDRRKAQELHFFPIGTGASLCGGILTTALSPANFPREDQLEFARRLVGSLGGSVKQRFELRKREHDIRFTEELLQLRSLSDRTYSTPLEMVETYLAAVQSMLEADGASLFLPALEGESGWKTMVRSEPALSPPLIKRWEQHEARLLDHCDQDLELQVFDAEDLQARGIDTLIRSALVVPLVQNKRVAGLCCFGRHGDRPFESRQRQLAVWAAQHLGKTLIRLQSIADIKRQAQQDGLTELANRRTFDEQLDREIRVAQRAKIPCSLLLCDLDRFKTVNDTFGHQAGDEALKIIARLLYEISLKTPAGDRALTARYGGEEMAIILPGQGEDSATRVAEEIRRAVAHETIWWQQLPIQVTISVGVATVPIHAHSAADLLAAADEALYLAKATGRNSVCSAPIVSHTSHV
jgi:diguanylate cyclase (GGDEF)-like protein